MDEDGHISAGLYVCFISNGQPYFVPLLILDNMTRMNEDNARRRITI